MADQSSKKPESSNLSQAANASLTNQQGNPDMAESSTSSSTSGVRSEELRGEVHQLKGDLSQIKRDMSRLGDHLMGEGKTQARRAQADASHRLESGYESVQHYIEDQPLKTMLIAFGVGVIFAKLFGR